MSGTDAGSKSAPDGYTFVLAGMSTLVMVPAMNTNAGFDPVRDFTHVAYFGGPRTFSWCIQRSGITSFQEFMTRAKSRATIEYVSPSVGSVGNMVAEFLAAKDGLKLVHVAYRGGSGALLDLVAGHVKVGMMSLSTAGSMCARAGWCRSRCRRRRGSRTCPTPTLKELGYPDLVATTWYSLSGPKGMATDVVERLNREVNKAMDDPKVKSHLAQETIQTRPMTPTEFTAFMTAEVEKVDADDQGDERCRQGEVNARPEAWRGLQGDARRHCGVLARSSRWRKHHA